MPEKLNKSAKEDDEGKRMERERGRRGSGGGEWRRGDRMGKLNDV